MRQDYHQRHYYDCPKCGAPGSLAPIATDRYGQQLYECGKCGKRTVESALEMAARERRLRD